LFVFAADRGACQGSRDDCCITASAAPDLRSENPADDAADDHARLFLLSRIGGASRDQCGD
jgi:hypothetical protein